MIKKDILTLFFIFLISLPSVRDLLKPGAYTSHDLGHHIPRLIHFDRILREGQFPPRWTGDLNKGYGYPLLLFNYPLPYYLGEIFHLLGFNFIWSTKLVLMLSLVGSIFTAYLLFRELFGRISGIVGAIFYLYAPIRFINVYVSATVGNALAFLFVPLPFYALARLKSHNDCRAIIIGAMGMGGLILSHNIMAYMFAPLIVTFFLILLSQKPQKKYFFSCLFMLLLGLGISSFFWLPAVVEKEYIRYAQILPGFYKSHFPTLKNLLYMPWGYGFSWPGDDPNLNPGRMSFQIGLIHLLIAGISLILIWRKFSSLAVFFLVSFFLSVFFMLKISVNIWDTFSFMQYLQMPWRLLAIAIFTTSALSAHLVSKVKNKLLIAFILIILVLFANRNHWHINQTLDVGDDFYRQLDGTTTMAGEHLPPWAMQRNKSAPARVEILTGLGSLRFNKALSGDLEFEAKIASSATILVNQYYFPGWKVLVDGQPLVIHYLDKREDIQGLIRFDLSQGLHKVQVLFTKTPVRALGDMLTVVTFIPLILFPFYPFPKWMK